MSVLFEFLAWFAGGVAYGAVVAILLNRLTPGRHLLPVALAFFWPAPLAFFLLLAIAAGVCLLIATLSSSILAALASIWDTVLPPLVGLFIFPRGPRGDRQRV